MLYHVTNFKETEDSACYDLLLDGKPVLEQVSYMDAFTYALANMADTDLFQYSECLQVEKDDDKPVTGQELRTTHVQRQAQIAAMDQQPCLRCEGVTTWIGYCDLQPRRWKRVLEHTFFMQCRDCGYYVQIGFANGDTWQADSYQRVMQDRHPWVRVAPDPFQRNGTLRVTSRVGENYMGRLNLDGHEYHCGEPIEVFDQELNRWREGRVEYGDNWYFIGADDYRDIDLQQGMRARRRASGYAR